MTIDSEISKSKDNPEELEVLYRQAPKKFSDAFPKIFAANPNSILMRAWQVRLGFDHPSTAGLKPTDLIVMVVLCLTAGTLLKAHEWGQLSDFTFYSRYFALTSFSAMFLFTMHMRQWPKKVVVQGSAAILLCAINISFIPQRWDDVFALASFSVPLFLWTLYGFARIESDSSTKNGRIEYIRFSGELLIHAGLLFLCGGVLLLLTTGIIELVGFRSSWILEDIALYGVASIALGASWATDTYSAARKLVPLLARIFAPLLLVLILTYMIVMALNIDALFKDRSTLLIYNLLLLSTLGTSIFILTGRKSSESGKLLTTVVSLMIFASLLLDILALYAICWRIFEFGLTSNRLAVMGSNIIVAGNLAVMGYGFINFWRKKGSIEDIETLISNYLPIYAIWSLFSIFVQPWIFRY